MNITVFEIETCKKKRIIDVKDNQTITLEQIFTRYLIDRVEVNEKEYQKQLSEYLSRNVPNV